MKRLKQTLLLTSLILLTLSCSNKELNRGIAFDTIKEFYNFPNVETMNFQGITSSQKLNKEYQELRGMNYISEKRKGKYGNEFWILMSLKGKAFTLSGEPNYKGYKVASSILELNEVTGIRFNDGKNTAYVDYNLKRTKVTPFGKTKGYNNGDLIKKQVVLQLYDDGWRITSDKVKNIIKPKDIKGFDEKYLSEINSLLKKMNIETSSSFCLIKKIEKLENSVLLTVDYVIIDNTNGIVNNNPKLRTFLLDNDAEIEGSFDFKNIKDINNNIIEHKTLFFISVQSGIVLKLSYQHPTDGSDAG